MRVLLHVEFRVTIVGLSCSLFVRVRVYAPATPAKLALGGVMVAKITLLFFLSNLFS